MSMSISISIPICSFSELFWTFRSPLHFHINFRISLSLSGKKKAAVILIGIVLNLQIKLERNDILRILSLLIQ